MPSIPSPSRAFGDRYRKPDGESRRDYFREANPYRQWRFRLSILLPLLVAGGLLACYYWPGGRFTDPRSHGTVSHSHTSIANDCAKCHKSLDNPLLDIHARWTTFDCSHCHAASKLSVDGLPPIEHRIYAPHNAVLFKHDLHTDNRTGERCGDCHHEHRGSDFALARVPDATCTTCHRDLNEFKPTIEEIAKESGKAAVVPKEFASFASHPRDYFSLPDPRKRGEERTLKFSHEQHLSPGIARVEGQLSSGRGTSSEGGTPVQLVCASCHQADSAGAYYQPVKYAKHCFQCHDRDLMQSLASGGETLNPIPVPHGLGIKLLGEKLAPIILQRLVEAKENADLNKLLGKRLAGRIREEIANSLQSERLFKANLMKWNLRTVACFKCHDIADGDVRRPNTPPVWLKASKFSHFAHKGANFDIGDKKCAVCHPSQQARFVDTLTPDQEKGDIGLPGFDSCLKCHSPKSRDFPDSGARHDCATCHKYHTPDAVNSKAPNPERQ